MNKHPSVLTPEIVVRDYGALIRKMIRSRPILGLSDEDIFQNILLAMIRPSPRHGTSYLERYDPTRANACTYVGWFTHRLLLAEYRRAQHEQAFDRSIDASSQRMKNRALYKTYSTEERSDERSDASRNDLLYRQIIERLSADEHRSFNSRSPRGRRRSTTRICLSIMLKDMSTKKIAEDLGMSTARIQQKLRELRADPVLRKLAEDHGFDVDAKSKVGKAG